MAEHDEPGPRFDGVVRLLCAVQQGSQSQLGPLLDLYRGFLLDQAGKELSSDVAVKASPSDVVQDTMLEATRAFAEFRGTTEIQLRAWLQQILSRKVIDTFRHYREVSKRDISREVPFQESMGFQRDPRESPQKHNTPFGQAVVVEKYQHLLQALQQLNAEDRLVIDLRMFQKKGFEEVGQVLGKSSDAARMQVTVR